jgi:enamine deaminase RidA (YjgF/YER057c/UK114 family)
MTGTSLHHDYLSTDDLATKSSSWWDGVLGVVGFEKPPSTPPPWVPSTASMTPALGSSQQLCEVWRAIGSDGPELRTAASPRGRVRYRYGDELLFGSTTIDETGFAGTVSTSLLRATEAAYLEIFAVLADMPHRHLIRVWNYLPEINREADGDERYRHFNSARQAAFRNAGRSTVGTVPAACALGSPAGSPISIYFLASSLPATMIENPRQTSAYFYPPKFGTHSPTFSRACVLRESGGTNLFVSGTASIVGHETIHHGDASAQTHESMTNIKALVEEANRIVGANHYSLAGLKLKVYVRKPSDLPSIEAALTSSLPMMTSIVYLEADICREDLLVEIEATGAAQGN